MKTTLALLVASTALTVAIGLPAWSAFQSLSASDARPIAGLLKAAGPDAPPVILASRDDDDDDDDDDDRRRSERDHEDDDDEHDDDDDDDDGGATMPDQAPAGAVAPPPNGLFGNGTPPQVQVN